MILIWTAGFLQQHQLAGKDMILPLALLPSKPLIIGVSWTLIFEIYFYLVFAAALCLRAAERTVAATTLAMMALYVCGGFLPDGALHDLLVAPIPLEFIFGLWLGIAYRRVGAATWSRFTSPWLLLLAIILCALAPLYIVHDDTTGLPGWPRIWAWGLPATLAVASMLSVTTHQRMTQHFLVLLGDASYALYLTHAFVMIGYGLILRVDFVDRLPQVAVVPAIVLVALVVGIGSHVMVEKPVTRLIRGRMT